MAADLKDFRSHLDPAALAAPVGSQPSSRLSSSSTADLRKQIEQATRPVWGATAAQAPQWPRWLAGVGVVAAVLASFRSCLRCATG